ncbi:hypothetical protein GWN60_26620, partial [candidate division KSB1 bacterium]|nr:hypothetical protein [candidate division KSB1 bacterium]
MVAPIIGLIIVLALTGSYFLQIEKQNELIETISDSDLATLSVYTELFTDLSRHHLELYELFNATGQQVDEGILYDRGVLIADQISSITKNMEDIIESGLIQRTMKKEEAIQLLENISLYRTAAISSIENSTVSLNRAPTYLNKANQQFSILHQKFAKELDIIRTRIQQEAKQNLKATRQRTILFAVFGLSSAIVLIIASFFTASLMSKKIRKIIDDLFSLTETTAGPEQGVTGATDEIERLILSLKSFENSLNTIKEQESCLKGANRQLQE